MFTDNEIAYLREQRIGRIATVDEAGFPHVVPTGFNINADKGVIEVGAHDLPGGRGQKRRYRRNLEKDSKVAFVVDDLRTDPWSPRGISVQGTAVIHQEGGERLAPGFGPIWVEIIPTKVSSWGIDTDAFEPPHTRTRP